MVLRRLILLAMICMLTGCGSPEAGRQPNREASWSAVPQGENCSGSVWQEAEFGNAVLQGENPSGSVWQEAESGNAVPQGENPPGRVWQEAESDNAVPQGENSPGRVRRKGNGWKAADTDPQRPDGISSMNESGNGGNPEQEMLCYLQQATVQIQGSRVMGSGTIWAKEEGRLVIATAAHVVSDNSPLAVRFGQGEPMEARLLFVSDQVDLAFLEVSLSEVETRAVPWRTARRDREVCERLEAGQPLWIMGSVREAADRICGGSVAEPWIFLEDFDNYMLLGHADVVPGESGGGVFTREGILAGILCGGNEADQIAVLPWSVMEAVYDIFSRTDIDKQADLLDNEN